MLVTTRTGLSEALMACGLPGLADGAVPGKYWVTVSKVEGTQSDPNMSAEEVYKQQSSNPAAAEKSDIFVALVFRVKPGSSKISFVET